MVVGHCGFCKIPAPHGEKRAAGGPSLFTYGSLVGILHTDRSVESVASSTSTGSSRIVVHLQGLNIYLLFTVIHFYTGRSGGGGGMMFCVQTAIAAGRVGCGARHQYRRNLVDFVQNMYIHACWSLVRRGRAVLLGGSSSL